MKKVLYILCVSLLFCGCARTDKGMENALKLRESLNAGKMCSFTVTITADYPTESYVFKMDCVSDERNVLHFTVTEPESIKGITGMFSDEEGKLLFDDQYLVFAPLVDGLITPVSAPWLFLKTLKSGYISGCETDNESIKVYYSDTYQNSSVDMIIEINGSHRPVAAEIIWQGRRIVTMDVEKFTIV